MSQFPFIPPQPNPMQSPVPQMQIPGMPVPAQALPNSPVPPAVDINRSTPPIALPPPDQVNPVQNQTQDQVQNQTMDKIGQQKLGAILEGLKMMAPKQQAPRPMPQPVQGGQRQVQSLGDILFRQGVK